MESLSVNPCNIEPPAPKALVLRLLSIAEGGTLTAPEAIRAGELFGITGNSMRVTLARLARSGLVEAAARGSYRLGPKSQGLGADVAAWSRAEDRLAGWHGGWAAVATGGLPRSDRKQLRVRERALSLVGLRELEGGLYLRPDNLEGGIAAMRARLHGLGLGAEAPVFELRGLDTLRQEKAMALWAGLKLEQTYAQTTAQLEGWLAGKDALPRETALREAYLIGDAGIRSVIFDPLLPAPLADEDARRRFFDCVRRFNTEGRRLWYAFFRADGG